MAQIAPAAANGFPDPTESHATAPMAGCGALSIGRVLILNSRLLYREALHAAIGAVLFGASIAVVGSVAEADRTLSEAAVDLLVTDIAAVDGDVLEKVPQWTARDNTVRNVLVVANDSAYLSEVLRRLKVSGLFDDREPAAAFKAAIEKIASGGAYWSPRVSVGGDADLKQIWQSLTLAEKAVLATVCDGTDDKTAAILLGRSPGTIRATREALHGKLLVHHRGELMRKAVALGCVVSTPEGMVRPGYAMLVDAYKNARGPGRKPRATGAGV